MRHRPYGSNGNVNSKVLDVVQFGGPKSSCRPRNQSVVAEAFSRLEACLPQMGHDHIRHRVELTPRPMSLGDRLAYQRRRHSTALGLRVESKPHAVWGVESTKNEQRAELNPAPCLVRVSTEAEPIDLRRYAACLRGKVLHQGLANFEDLLAQDVVCLRGGNLEPEAVAERPSRPRRHGLPAVGSPISELSQ